MRSPIFELEPLVARRGMSEFLRIYSALAMRAARVSCSASSAVGAVESEIHVIFQPCAFNSEIADLIGAGSTNSGMLLGRGGTKISFADRPSSKTSGVVPGSILK